MYTIVMSFVSGCITTDQKSPDIVPQWLYTPTELTLSQQKIRPYQNINF